MSKELTNSNFDINEFDPETIPKFATILILASRRSGKSVLTRHWLYKEFLKKRKIKNLVIVSPTIHNGDYAFVDDKFKFTSFDKEFLDKILNRQLNLIKSDPHGNNEMVLLLDDIIKSTNTETKDQLSRLFTLSRHYQLTILLVSQSLRHECTPCCRFNTDIVVAFASRNYDNKKEIADLWLGFGKKEDRDNAFEILDEVAKGYRAIVINNTVHSNEPSDIIFHYEVDVEHSVPKGYFFDG